MKFNFEWFWSFNVSLICWFWSRPNFFRIRLFEVIVETLMFVDCTHVLLYLLQHVPAASLPSGFKKEEIFTRITPELHILILNTLWLRTNEDNIGRKASFKLCIWRYVYTYEWIRQWPVTDIGGWPLVNELSGIWFTSCKWIVAK